MKVSKNINLTLKTEALTASGEEGAFNKPAAYFSRSIGSVAQ